MRLQRRPETVGQILIKIDPLIVGSQMPLVLGDNSCSVRHSGKRDIFLFFHMEAGNRCLTSVPEETNRKIVGSCVGCEFDL
jgi:UDP-N-acetylglucosamine 2-epimerase